MNPPPAVLMFTSYSDDEALFEAIMAGASGYLLKRVMGTDLIGAVRRVAAGESLLDPGLVGSVLERLRRGPEEDPRYAALGDQERRILDLIGEGLTNKQIAERVFLAEKTVKNYISGMLRKLGVSSRTGAAMYLVDRVRRPER
jgi:DNA-binding NarL/FixJ family response regulator